MEPIKQISSHFGNQPFSYSDLKKIGINQRQIRLLLKDQQIQRINRGIYLVSGSDLTDQEQFRAATLRVGSPSAICLFSALSHYDLIDAIPKKVWILVSDTKHTTHKDIRLLRSRNPKWKTGIVESDGFKITTIERTIIDALTMKAVVGSSLGIEALKKALKSKKTTPSKLFEMAKALKVVHRIQATIEALI